MAAVSASVRTYWRGPSVLFDLLFFIVGLSGRAGVVDLVPECFERVEKIGVAPGHANIVVVRDRGALVLIEDFEVAALDFDPAPAAALLHDGGVLFHQTLQRLIDVAGGKRRGEGVDARGS